MATRTVSIALSARALRHLDHLVSERSPVTGAHCRQDDDDDKKDDKKRHPAAREGHRAE